MIVATPAARPFGAVNKMTAREFESWRSYIYDMTGIYFQDGKKYLLESRLQRRMRFLKLNSFDDYFNFVKYNSSGKVEFNYLLDAITINETYFFRNQPQLDALITTILPNLIESKKERGKNKIKIWSAASSSGEEAYSIAMIINELIKPKYPNFIFEIVGTDLSSSVIETAKSGVYKEYSIRNMPRHFLKKYFKIDNGAYHLDESIKKYASFKILNLYDDKTMSMMYGYDIIFCANVLIYFDIKSKIKVVSNLYNSLSKNGFLFIGYSETLHGISKAFKVTSFPKTVGYLKE